MKRFAMVLLSLTLITIPLLAKESDEAGIRATDEVFAAAWNKHDAKAMAATWAKDGDLVNPFGRVAKGRAEVEGTVDRGNGLRVVVLSIKVGHSHAA